MAGENISRGKAFGSQWHHILSLKGLYACLVENFDARMTLIKLECCFDPKWDTHLLPVAWLLRSVELIWAFVQCADEPQTRGSFISL